MGLQRGCISLFKLGYTGLGLVLTFYTCCRLVWFLSDPHFKVYEEEDHKGNLSHISSKLLTNMTLLTLFILQHSCLALPPVKKFFQDWKIEDLQRSTYIILTCSTLLVLLNRWQIIHEFSTWTFNTRGNALFWMFLTVHAIAWLIIYVGNICMDVTELLGIKQVYYSLRNLPEPYLYKSHQLRKLYSHMRHPSLLGFLIVFWICPVMTLDRLLLSIILTLYMFISWKTDETDYHYQEMQHVRKFYVAGY